jgi:hypothetical protein
MYGFLLRNLKFIRFSFEYLSFFDISEKIHAGGKNDCFRNIVLSGTAKIPGKRLDIAANSVNLSSLNLNLVRYVDLGVSRWRKKCSSCKSRRTGISPGK